MKCVDCGEDILQKDPWKCPYCGSSNLISAKDVVSNSIAEIEKLEKAGRYEAAALSYEKLGMFVKSERNKTIISLDFRENLFCLETKCIWVF